MPSLTLRALFCIRRAGLDPGFEELDLLVGERGAFGGHALVVAEAFDAADQEAGGGVGGDDGGAGVSAGEGVGEGVHAEFGLLVFLGVTVETALGEDRLEVGERKGAARGGGWNGRGNGRWRRRGAGRVR